MPTQFKKFTKYIHHVCIPSNFTTYHIHLTWFDFRTSPYQIDDRTFFYVYNIIFRIDNFKIP